MRKSILKSGQKKSLKKHIKSFEDFKTMKDLEVWFGFYLQKPNRPSFPLFVFTNELDQVCVDISHVTDDYTYNPKNIVKE